MKLYDVGLSTPVYGIFVNGLVYGYLPGVTIDEDLVRDPPIYK